MILLSLFGVFAYNLTNETNQTTNYEFQIINISDDLNVEEEINPYKNLKLNDKIFANEYILSKGISQKAKDKQNNLLSQNIHMIFQFNKVPTKNEISELEKQGIKIINYISNNAYYVSVSNNFL